MAFSWKGTPCCGLIELRPAPPHSPLLRVGRGARQADCVSPPGQETVRLLPQHRLVHHDPGPGALRGDRRLWNGQRQLLQVGPARPWQAGRGAGEAGPTVRLRLEDLGAVGCRACGLPGGCPRPDARGKGLSLQDRLDANLHSVCVTYGWSHTLSRLHFLRRLWKHLEGG